MSKTEMMTIAFPFGGILPSDVTGGAEKHIDAHEAVDVPRAYGQHLVDDKFAYVPDAKGKAKEVGISAADRKAIDKKLGGLRDDLKKATTDDDKARLTAEIAALEAQLAPLP